MKKNIRNSFYFIILMGVGLAGITGCSSIDQISSAPMVKVKCRENHKAEPKHICTTEKKSSSEKMSRVLLKSLQTPLQYSVVAITGRYLVKKISTLGSAEKRSSKGTDTKRTVASKSIRSDIIKKISGKEYPDRKTADEGDGAIIVIILLLIIIGAFLVFLVNNPIVAF